MGGHDAGNEQPFPGIAKYFSLHTQSGRRHCLSLTYASIIGMILYFTLRPKKQPAVTEK